ncbi:glutamine-hydrolyzing carbamoyl-phosphate synthase small subunit [Glycomyces sp. A-F 0318]|uniref:glutamine-hydrolyzing carbamoyl-phosphate synthase small subunit n=1 Tax=Glycomyces amatae TaxID=2881355 RepID=UPI001E33B0D3|nr:glutamine-hydrolyzing carbamoyl-phosphate synthase small subunit [Glycomyces amatae]MCD0446692.1 glutamine-hydrolyzing carbamoyl-phosphate synthase small subunit [Glycomyces amatae]
MSSRAPAILVLEDGRVFRGEAFGSVGETFGEAVFSTGMTGYQETLTDPSYYGQVVAQTAPQIGNTGWNDEDDESRRIWVAGYVVRDASRITSNWRAERGLEDELASQGVVGICEVDTRALTRHLREAGAMRVGISSRSTDVEELLAKVRISPQMAGANHVGAVTASEPYTYAAEGTAKYTVAALDLGIKRNTPRRLAARGITTTVYPAYATVDQLLAEGPDAVFLSNGPGDPATADHQVELTRELLRRRVPVFGICFGNQILGRALGLGTYKLKYGHRGINQPVLDRHTEKIEITAHNHGFALAAPESGEFFETEFGRVQVSHVCLNDDVVEGLTCLDVPAYSVQYHPEAAGGPHDADYLFDRLIELIDTQHGGAVNSKGAKADA